MPMQLRSGTVKEAPKRKHISAYSVFYHEIAPKFKSQGMAVSEQSQKISNLWKELDDKEKDKYEEMFQKFEQEYNDLLVIHYGGTQKDAKSYRTLQQIPERPKKPISSCLQYMHDNRHQFTQENPDLTFSQVSKQLVEKFNDLPNKEKRKYDERYENLSKEYQKELEVWNKKYSQKQLELDQFVEEKFKKSAQKEELDYQELQKVKRPRQLQKMEDNEETKSQEDKKKKNKESKQQKDNKDQKEQKDNKDKNNTKDDKKKNNELKPEEPKKDNRKKSVGKK